MKYLFIHQNFPGQYLHLVRHLVSIPGNEVYFITQPNGNEIAGVRKIVYAKDERPRINCHAYTLEFDRAIYNAATVADTCRALKAQGFKPDIIVGHSGWGETMFVKDVFPDVPLLANFEFYYHYQGIDVGFDPEFDSVFQDPSRLRARNATNLVAFEGCDWGHSATAWQRSLFPEAMRARITAVHEGVDTDIVRPHAQAVFRLPGSNRVLTCRDEVITYVARNLEPYRGFHIFMRALPEILRRRKRAQVVIAGGDGVSYGMPPPPQSSFREQMLNELGDRLELSRVHFVGRIEYHDYLNLLQVSSAHVYLTYPFVLSWSFIEAMASGCLVIGSRTPPVEEVLRDGFNGLAVDFFSYGDLAERLHGALARPAELRPLREAARETAVQQYDLKNVLLPRWQRLMNDLVRLGHPESTASIQEAGRIPRVPPRKVRSRRNAARR